jgi:hypothetical protein
MKATLAAAQKPPWLSTIRTIVLMAMALAATLIVAALLLTVPKRPGVDPAETSAAVQME